MSIGQKHLNIAIKVGGRVGERKVSGNLGNIYFLLGDFPKAIEYHEKHLNVPMEVDDRIGKGKPYRNIGNEYVSVEQFENALHNFVSAVHVFNTLRSLLRSEDGWKIYFHELHDKTYTALRRLLIRIGKIDGSLFAAEQGRAQTLSDNLLT